MGERQDIPLPSGRLHSLLFGRCLHPGTLERYAEAC